MNVLFLDFDGVLDTINHASDQDVEERIKLLGDICSELDCKVVIESALKDSIDEETLKTESRWIKEIFNMFNKYNIECIGRTPSLRKKVDNKYYPVWKEDEIRLYLYRHPEIEHYCIIDDDDFYDLNKVKDHLVKTIYYSKNSDEEGLLPKHKEEIKEVLKKENRVRKYVLKKQLGV